ncbi:hypothetical protein BCR41DRAFT_395457 [Lobosporangium transversale]|uniref:Uncharacterized protein n=1 Tax=Lobosporangium transversale TaxID=64571 RepID=A0A1Y2GPK4_9FUNG|nr:hypothetical protein BCR41DRAFT_395457 [Lobosporangium transversale]ORZ18219.1 hypothetical protein BCR41DRAFT_395457 [Lobosporangium transversale]|eukprot:XP_021882014.1 hypothetical protein BCR41DRAFT_395457 [Lobosporangium transversale]
MFIPLSFLALKAILSLCQIVIVGGFGAILGIYSRFGGEYANSIRWVRQGGYFEMSSLLLHFPKRIPIRAKIAMVVAFIMALLVSLADKAVWAFVKRSQEPRFISTSVISTPQHIISVPWTTFSGWSTSMRAGTSIVETMKQMLGDHKRIPSAVPGRLYEPTISSYEESCKQLDLNVHYDMDYNTTLTNGSCSTVYLMAPIINSVRNNTNVNIVKRSSDQWSISVPIKTSPEQLHRINWIVIQEYKNQTCIVSNPNTYHGSAASNSMDNLPATSALKCIHQTGDISIVTVTSTEFSARTTQKFRQVSTKIFGEYNDMFRAMEAHASNPTLTTSQQLLVEVQIVDSTVYTLICYWGQVSPPKSTTWKCTYLIFDAVVLKPQVPNAEIAKARGNRPLSKLPEESTTNILISHSPSIVNNTLVPIPLSALRIATLEASQYLSSLGQNFYHDWEASRMYIQYDMSDMIEGYEVPDWLFGCVITSVCILFILWVWTEIKLDTVYTSSLYKNVAIEMEDQVHGRAPLLMRFNVSETSLEGVPILESSITMFLTVHEFYINLFLAIFQFVLIGTLGAILAIYSRFGNEYASSVNWSRQGGYREMLMALINSRRNAPRTTLIVLAITLFVSFPIGFAGTGAAWFIRRASKPIDITARYIRTPQFAPVGDYKHFSDWKFPIQYGDNVTEVLSRALSDTKNIANAEDGHLYQPRQKALAQSKAMVTTLSDNRWRMAVPFQGEISVLNTHALPQIDYKGMLCAIPDLYPPFEQTIKDGMINIPRTRTTKCVTGRGEVGVVSFSSVYFQSMKLETFRDIASSVFIEYDEMLQAMESNLNNPSFTTNSTLLAEIQSDEFSVNVLACAVSVSPSSRSIRCSYNIFSTILARAPKIDPVISNTFNASFPRHQEFSNMAIFEHFPKAVEGFPMRISISGLRYSTISITIYMARLGYSFIPDWVSSSLYVLYDIKALERGNEVPTWLIWLVGVITGACIVLWGIVEWKLDYHYTRSLHKIISTKIETQYEARGPKLVRSSFKPLNLYELLDFGTIPTPEQCADTPPSQRVLALIPNQKTLRKNSVIGHFFKSSKEEFQCQVLKDEEIRDISYKESGSGYSRSVHLIQLHGNLYSALQEFRSYQSRVKSIVPLPDPKEVDMLPPTIKTRLDITRNEIVDERLKKLLPHEQEAYEKVLLLLIAFNEVMSNTINLTNFRAAFEMINPYFDTLVSMRLT